VQLDIAALCDVDATTLSQAADLLPDADRVAQVCSSEEFWQEELDAVVLSLPHQLYANEIKQALARGVRVIKEKPFALHLREAIELSLLAQEAETPLSILTKRSCYPSYRRVEELLDADRLGTAYHYQATHSIPHGTLYAGWRSRWETAGGGVLVDMGYHLLERLYSYFGAARVVGFTSQNLGNQEHDYPVEDTAQLMLEHENGVIGSLQLAAMAGPKQERIEISGTDGSLVVEKERVEIWSRDGTVDEEQHRLPELAATRAALRRALSVTPLENRSHLEKHIALQHLIEQAYSKKHTPQGPIHPDMQWITPRRKGAHE
jgi:predicted dehydrogenase